MRFLYRVLESRILALSQRYEAPHGEYVRKNLTWVDTGFTDISDGRALNHVPHCEALDGLIFCDATRAVRATNKSDVATTLLVAAAISSFLGLSGRD